MEIVNSRLLMVLRAYGQELISLDELRAFLAEVFFSAPSEAPFDRMIIGELELAISEFDRGDREEGYIRQLAEAFARLFELVLALSFTRLVRV